MELQQVIGRALQYTGFGGLIAGFTCVDSVNSLLTISVAAGVLGIGIVLLLPKR